MQARLSTLVFGILLANSLWAVSVDYEYDARGRLIELWYEDGVRVTYAYDDAGNRTSEVYFVADSVSFNLDIDDNARADALTDGLLVLRYLFGFGNPSLTAGAVAPDADREPRAIQNYLAGGVAVRALDINLDGQTDARTDGLLVLRYLAGLRGQPLIHAAVIPGTGRDNAADIEAYLNGLLP